MMDFVTVDILPVGQFQSGRMLVGKMHFKDLLKICKFTQRIESSKVGLELEKSGNDEGSYYQRTLSKTRLASIACFLEEEYKNTKDSSKSAIGMFPTALILEMDLSEDPSQEGYNVKDTLKKDVDDACVLDAEKNKLYVPVSEKKYALIIDGQHRFAGMKKLFDETNDNELKTALEEFEFITVFLLGLDLYIQGKIFATINFTQKSVNKSIYYDIFGSLPDADSDMRLAHELVLYMQNGETPLKGMIKLLGINRGLVSQAFFVEAILPHFRKGVWKDILVDYENGGKKFKILPIFMKAYFESIKERFNAFWPTDGVYSPWHYKKPLCKTNGMGAFLKLINDIYPLVEKLETEEQMKKKLLGIFSKINDREANGLFSENGRYAGSGSAGLQNALYKTLRDTLGLNSE